MPDCRDLRDRTDMTAHHDPRCLEPDDLEVVRALDGLTAAQLRALWAGMERCRVAPENTVELSQLRHEFIAPGGQRFIAETILSLARRGLMDVTGAHPHRRARLSRTGRWYARASIRLFTAAAANAAIEQEGARS